MALLEGKTAEEIASEIMTDKTVMVEVSGLAAQNVETVVRYLNRDAIQARGQVWFDKNHDRLVTDTIETLVNARAKAIVDYMNKKELQAKDELFRTLVSRGVAKDEAYKSAYIS